MSKKQYNKNKKLEQSTIKEPQDFHPQVEAWLTQNGYTFQHEVPMPEYGIADFIIANPENTQSVLECKWFTGNDFGRMVAQLLDYMRQMKMSGIMAIPEQECDEWRRGICAYYGVALLPIPENPMLILKELKEVRYAEYKDHITVLNSDEVEAFVNWHNFCSLNYAGGVFAYHIHSSIPMSEVIWDIVDDITYVINHVAIPDMKRKLNRDEGFISNFFGTQQEDNTAIKRSEVYTMVWQFIKAMGLIDQYATPADYLSWIKQSREMHIREHEIAMEISKQVPDEIQHSETDLKGKTLMGIVLEELGKALDD